MNRPLLSAAFTCERVLHEVDGVLTAVRIVDSYTVSAVDADAKVLVKPWIVVIFKSGAAQGTYSVSFRMRPPSGPPSVLGDAIPIELRGGPHGATLAIELIAEVKEEGVYWVDVLLDGDLVTSMPITLRRTPGEGGVPGPPLRSSP